MNDNLNLKTAAMASAVSALAQSDQVEAKGRYVAKCFDAAGNLKWEEHFDNLVTDTGVKDMLDKYTQGSGYTGTFYMGLISLASYASGPVVADSATGHAGWVEAGAANAPTYAAATRPSVTWSAATGSGANSRNKATSAVAFTFNGAGSVKGIFISTSSTKDGTAGTLFSAGLFGADKAVGNTDTLQVTYQLTI